MKAEGMYMMHVNVKSRRKQIHIHGRKHRSVWVNLTTTASWTPNFIKFVQNGMMKTQNPAPHPQWHPRSLSSRSTTEVVMSTHLGILRLYMWPIPSWQSDCSMTIQENMLGSSRLCSEIGKNTLGLLPRDRSTKPRRSHDSPWMPSVFPLLILLLLTHALVWLTLCWHWCFSTNQHLHSELQKAWAMG